MYTAMWADQKDIAQPDVIEDVLTTAGLDAAAMGDAIQQPDIKESLIDATNAAVETGVFGAPTMILGDELYWGKDRMDFIEDQLRDG